MISIRKKCHSKLSRTKTLLELLIFKIVNKFTSTTTTTTISAATATTTTPALLLFSRWIRKFVKLST